MAIRIDGRDYNDQAGAEILHALQERDESDPTTPAGRAAAREAQIRADEISRDPRSRA